MRYVNLGKTDMKVSELALGTWAFAGGFFWGEQDEKASIDTVAAALDYGINFVDTAEAYEAGVSEKVVGKALKGKRDKVILASKVVGPHMRAAEMVSACEETLKNLQTDYLDMYYLHWPNMDVPFEETMEALYQLQKSGKIRAGGCSNYGLKQMEMLEMTGLSDMLQAHQLPYNLFWRAIEYGVKKKTMDMGMSIVCYSSLAQGLLTGNFRKIEDVPEHLKVVRFYADPENKRHGGPGCEKEAFEAVAKLDALCKEAGLTMPEACLAWLRMQTGVTSILTGPRSVKELDMNVKSVDVTISQEMADKMTEISEPVRIKIGGNTDMWCTGANIRSY